MLMKDVERVLVKDNVVKIEIYDSQERYIGATKVFSFTEKKGLFKMKNDSLTVKVMSNNLPTFSKGDLISLVFEYFNGSRYKTETEVEGSGKTHVECKVNGIVELAERRRYFKMTTNEEAVIYKSKKANEAGVPGVILNINLGGVLLQCEDVPLAPGEFFYLNTLRGALELYTKVLRVQTDIEGNLVGYGCQFQKATEEQEEIIARYIMSLQIAERERRRAMDLDDDD